METTIFEKSRKWMHLNARPIDLARFQYLFENGSREAVLMALSEYQNDDGGFGYALEADSFNPMSSPIQTWTATEILWEIGLDEGHPIIQGILTYLESGKDFNGSCWLNTVPTNNDYPRASWWTYEKESFNKVNYNPTAALVGFALRFAWKESDLYKKCFHIAEEAIRVLKTSDTCDEMHILACYVRMAQYCRMANLVQELHIVELEEILAQRIDKVITKDTEKWTTWYVSKPSQFFESKDSYLYPKYKELAEFECEFIRNAQKEDGTWSVNWSWDEYSDEWKVAKNWWKACIIIVNLKFLKEMEKRGSIGLQSMIRKLYCVNLHTNQMDEMIHFYHDLLQIPITFPGYNNNTDGIKFGLGVDQLQICLWKEENWGKGKGPVEIAIRGDLKEIYNCLKANQYTKAELKHESYGDCLTVYDPDGNQLTMM